MQTKCKALINVPKLFVQDYAIPFDEEGFSDIKLETSDAVSEMEHVSDTSVSIIYNCSRNGFYSNCY